MAPTKDVRVGVISLKRRSKANSIACKHLHATTAGQIEPEFCSRAVDSLPIQTAVRILFVCVDLPMTLPEKRIKRLSDGLSLSMNRLTKEASPKYVHRLRTTIRRIESVLAFTNPDLNKKQKKTMDEVGQLRRRAGRIRDLDVQAELLGAIGNRSAAGDRKLVMDLLRRRRAKQANRFQEELSRIKG